MRRIGLAALLLAAAAAPAYGGGSFTDVAAGSHAVWVSGPIGVVKLDARTGNEARRYILPALYPTATAVGDGAVWVASVVNGYTSGTVTRIDLRTGAAHTIFARERWPAQAVAVGGRTVWVSFGSRIGRFDPAGRLLGATRVEPGGGWLAADAHGAWFCCRVRRPLRIDSDGQAHASFVLPIADPIWAAGGSLWLDALSTLDRIDEHTGRIVARIPLRSVTDVDVVAGAVYALQDGALSRIDPATNRIVARRSLPGTTQAVSAGPTGVWVTSVPLSMTPPERVFRLNPRTLATELTVSLT